MYNRYDNTIPNKSLTRYIKHAIIRDDQNLLDECITELKNRKNHCPAEDVLIDYNNVLNAAKLNQVETLEKILKFVKNRTLTKEDLIKGVWKMNFEMYISNLLTTITEKVTGYELNLIINILNKANTETEKYYIERLTMGTVLTHAKKEVLVKYLYNIMHIRLQENSYEFIYNGKQLYNTKINALNSRSDISEILSIMINTTNLKVKYNNEIIEKEDITNYKPLIDILLNDNEKENEINYILDGNSWINKKYLKYFLSIEKNSDYICKIIADDIHIRFFTDLKKNITTYFNYQTVDKVQQIINILEDKYYIKIFNKLKEKHINNNTSYTNALINITTYVKIQRENNMIKFILSMVKNCLPVYYYDVIFDRIITSYDSVGRISLLLISVSCNFYDNRLLENMTPEDSKILKKIQVNNFEVLEPFLMCHFNEKFLVPIIYDYVGIDIFSFDDL